MRLTGFDYSRPYFYMVTLKCLRGAEPLSAIIAPGKCEMSRITKAFVHIIRNFHTCCAAIAEIECFSIMPDHIHILVKIIENPSRMRLESIVGQLMTALESCYQQITGKRGQLFEAVWHDWIILREGQLAAFTRYIRQNPQRHWLRKERREYFRRVEEVDFLGRRWHGYGNAALLELPVIEPFKCSRKWAAGGDEWNAAMVRAARIGPGGAGIGTFMSECEKACGNAIVAAGGSLIVLSPEGFGQRWHPSEKQEKFCALGKMLFLSLYPYMARQPTNKELYDRCHEMGDIVESGLRNESGMRAVAEKRDT